MTIIRMVLTRFWFTIIVEAKVMNFMNGDDDKNYYIDDDDDDATKTLL